MQTGEASAVSAVPGGASPAGQPPPRSSSGRATPGMRDAGCGLGERGHLTAPGQRSAAAAPLGSAPLRPALCTGLGGGAAAALAPGLGCGRIKPPAGNSSVGSRAWTPSASPAAAGGDSTARPAPGATGAGGTGGRGGLLRRGAPRQRAGPGSGRGGGRQCPPRSGGRRTAEKDALTGRPLALGASRCPPGRDAAWRWAPRPPHPAAPRFPARGGSLSGPAVAVGEAPGGQNMAQPCHNLPPARRALQRGRGAAAAPPRVGRCRGRCGRAAFPRIPELAPCLCAASSSCRHYFPFIRSLQRLKYPSFCPRRLLARQRLTQRGGGAAPREGPACPRDHCACAGLCECPCACAPARARPCRASPRPQTRHLLLPSRVFRPCRAGSSQHAVRRCRVRRWQIASQLLSTALRDRP